MSIVPKPRRYQTTSSEEGKMEKKSRNKTQMEQNSQLEDDVAELREVLQNDSDTNNMPVYSEQSLTHTQSSANNYKEYISNTQHASDTTYSVCTQPLTQTTRTFSPSVTSHPSTYTQSFTVSQTTQSFCPSITSHSPSYTQLLNVNHGTQAHSMHNNNIQPLTYTSQNYNTAHTFTHESYPSTHIQNIRSGLNTPYDTQLQAPNTWPNESHRLNNSSVPSSSRAPGDIYNVRPEIQKIHQKLDKILQQTTNNRRHIPEKPAFLPISSVADVENFETVDDEEYMKLVNYLIFIGGFNVKESINLYVKEVFQDILMTSYTWFGRDENQRPLFNTRLVKAIYDAICENKNFEKPMRAAFQTYMRDAARTAKQRHRNKARNNLGRLERGNQNRRACNLWSDGHDEQDERVQSETEEN
ncbi:uncharacterized protein [Anoplolepis gracilipes]|uniref:uncharacterized protein n=1 Tax=Anoplolepis gracilipes TaxID=354296 RepID=UPI003B9E412F